jgi:2-iminobutanoate/2-iminopropanoate deaminase
MMEDVKHVTHPDMYQPPAPMSHAVLANGYVHVSGQVPRDPQGGAPEGAAAQVELALTNLARVLDAAGMTLEDVVFLRTFATDREILRAWVKLRRDRFGGARPAGTSVLVSGLADERWRIEVEAVAYRAGA